MKNKEPLSSKIQKLLTMKKILFEKETVESTIDVSGLLDMIEDGKTLIEFFKHKKIGEISSIEIQICVN